VIAVAVIVKISLHSHYCTFESAVRYEHMNSLLPILDHLTKRRTPCPLLNGSCEDDFRFSKCVPVYTRRYIA